MKEKFDPNLHNALFEIPDPGQKPGTIAVVTKVSHSSQLRCKCCIIVALMQAWTAPAVHISGQ